MAHASNRSRWSGLFFSLGHGAVVTLVGVVVALAAAEWQAPAWLQQVGVAISVSVLLVLGAANLATLLRVSAQQPVPLVGLRGRWFANHLCRTSHPVFVASIGGRVRALLRHPHSRTYVLAHRGHIGRFAFRRAARPRLHRWHDAHGRAERAVGCAAARLSAGERGPSRFCAWGWREPRHRLSSFRSRFSASARS
jgi:hypothetical protein